MRAGSDKKATDVSRMFDDVANRYDITNDVLSLGLDRYWRRQTVAALNTQPGDVVLDLAAGTGTSTAPIAATGAFAVPCDFSTGMLTVGKSRLPSLPFVAGDALELPFSDNTFDAVTMSFGLRNLNDPLVGLQEMRRVTRVGGRLVLCEFSQPVWPPFATVYIEYLMRAIPVVAERIASNPEAYVYLAESIRAWPDQAALAAMIGRSGWGAVAWRNFTGGIVALHRARCLH